MRSACLVLALFFGACATSPTSHRPAGPLVIRNARVFDAKTSAVHNGMIIIIEGNTILGVEHDADVVPPPNAEIIDARGRMVLPSGPTAIEAGAPANLVLVEVVLSVKDGVVHR